MLLVWFAKIKALSVVVVRNAEPGIMKIVYTGPVSFAPPIPVRVLIIVYYAWKIHVNAVIVLNATGWDVSENAKLMTNLIFVLTINAKWTPVSVVPIVLAIANAAGTSVINRLALVAFFVMDLANVLSDAVIHLSVSVLVTILLKTK